MDASLPAPELVEDEEEPDPELEPAQPGAVVSDWQLPEPLVPVVPLLVPVPVLEESVPLPLIVPLLSVPEEVAPPASARRLVPELLLSVPLLPLEPELCAELPLLSREPMSEQPASAAKPSAAAAVVTQNRVVMFHLIAVASG